MRERPGSPLEPEPERKRNPKKQPESSLQFQPEKEIPKEEVRSPEEERLEEQKTKAQQEIELEQEEKEQAITEIEEETKEEKEIKERINKIKKEFYRFRNVENITPETLSQMLDELDKLLDKEKTEGKGKLKANIQEIIESFKDNKTGEIKDEYFVDGHIAYLPKRGEAIFVGDLHGDAEAVESILEQTGFIERMERGEKDVYLVFLGDYGDRGYKQIEAIAMVIDLKLRYPNNVILLRGNHEEKEIGKRDGLFDALNQRYGGDQNNLN
ncbi:MAG: hypothetical protein C4348_01930, partial [Patescibacteria group bacterium]